MECAWLGSNLNLLTEHIHQTAFCDCGEFSLTFSISAKLFPVFSPSNIYVIFLFLLFLILQTRQHRRKCCLIPSAAWMIWSRRQWKFSFKPPWFRFWMKGLKKKQKHKNFWVSVKTASKENEANMWMHESWGVKGGNVWETDSFSFFFLTCWQQSWALNIFLTLSRSPAGGLPGTLRKDESSEVLGQYCGL